MATQRTIPTGEAGPARDTAAGPREGAPADTPDTVDLMGVGFFRGTEAQCVSHVIERSLDGAGGWIVTPNIDILRKLCTEPDVRELTGPVDLFVADGMPLIWASRLQGTPLPQRVCGSNLILSLSEAAARHDLSVFLLGGDEGAAEQAADELRRRFAGIRIVGTHCPPFGFEADAEHWGRLESAVVEAGPDIVFVALGFPRQERVIARVRERLRGAWYVGVGISFSFVAGRVRRAPRWMQAVGLEWVHRLCQEPRRLIRRYLIDDIPFAIRVLLVSAGRRLRGTGGRRRRSG